MSTNKEKIAISFLCALGVFGVGYGMGTDNDVIFVVGILLVVAGYLSIRRKLKDALRKQSQ